MDRHNHYEAAFAAFLRDKRVTHVAVDESRRSYEGDHQSIKSVDFIVHGREGERFVVDIKGRRFPGGKPEKPKRTWECWATQADVTDAQHWASKFGTGYRALFIFSYHLVNEELDKYQDETLWTWQEKRYCLRAIPVDEYAQAMRVLSSKWGTVYLPTSEFHRLARPLSDLLSEVRL